MKTFEQQLSASARRLRDADNYRLPAPRRPRRPLQWGWITTPAAAIVGLLMGTVLPRQADAPVQQVAKVRVIDTIVRQHTVRDTVYLPAVTDAAAGVHPAEEELHNTSAAPADTNGRNVRSDGVDYNLLVRL